MFQTTVFFSQEILQVLVVVFVSGEGRGLETRGDARKRSLGIGSAKAAVAPEKQYPREWLSYPSVHHHGIIVDSVSAGEKQLASPMNLFVTMIFLGLLVVVR